MFRLELIVPLQSAENGLQRFDAKGELCSGAHRTTFHFFTPRTVSFATLATRNFNTVLAGILIFCCVFGLKPVRAFLFCFTSLPKPGKTNSPFFLISLYASALSVSRNTPAGLLLVSVAAARAP